MVFTSTTAFAGSCDMMISCGCSAQPPHWTGVSRVRPSGATDTPSGEMYLICKLDGVLGLLPGRLVVGLGNGATPGVEGTPEPEAEVVVAPGPGVPVPSDALCEADAPEPLPAAAEFGPLPVVFDAHPASVARSTVAPAKVF